MMKHDSDVSFQQHNMIALCSDSTKRKLDDALGVEEALVGFMEHNLIFGEVFRIPSPLSFD